jgi:hypothetical protein
VSGTYNSNPVTGRFILLVNPFKKYKIVVQYEGYKTLSSDIEPMVQEEQIRNLEFNLEKE